MYSASYGPPPERRLVPLDLRRGVAVASRVVLEPRQLDGIREVGGRGRLDLGQVLECVTTVYRKLHKRISSANAKMLGAPDTILVVLATEKPQ